jgi:hypothetical protein
MTAARLNDRVVARIFDRMLGVYGNLFLSKFSRIENDTDVGLSNAKDVWAEELGGFADNLDAIAAGLKNLPHDFPPNAMQFADLCRAGAKHIKSNAPVPALTYTPDPVKAKAFAAELAKVVDSPSRGIDPIFWATHPKSQLAWEFIRAAAEQDPVRFEPCVQHLIDEGRVSPDRLHLLKRYAGGGDWFKA